MTTIETITKENIELKNIKLKLEKNCKYLKHDIYFLNKNIKELEIERNKYKDNCEKILIFANEYNIKCIEDILHLLDKYKKDKDFNKYSILEDENTLLKNKIMKYEIHEIVKKGFDTNILYNIINNNSNISEKEEINKVINVDPKVTLNNSYNKELNFEDICNIPLPNIDMDEEVLLNSDITFKNNNIKLENTKKRNTYKKTNQLEVVNNILDKITKKVKDTKFYKIKLERNKTLIKLYSYLYNNKETINDEEKEDLIIDEKIRDLNSYRFNKNCNIYNSIYNNSKIIESDYVFLPGLFENVNNNYIDLLIYKLELLCSGENIDKIKVINKLNDEDNIKFQNIDNLEIIKKALNIKLI